RRNTGRFYTGACNAEFHDQESSTDRRAEHQIAGSAATSFLEGASIPGTRTVTAHILGPGLYLARRNTARDESQCRTTSFCTRQEKHVNAPRSPHSWGTRTYGSLRECATSIA